MDKKKNGNIFKSSEYSTSTAFDKNYNIIMKAAEVYNSKKSQSEKNK